MSIATTGPPRPSGPSRPRVLDATSIYVALLLFGATVGGVYLLIRLQFLLVILFLSLLVASGIVSPVRRLERWGIPRAVAILAVYLIIIGILAGITWYVMPPVLGQAADLAQDAPRRLRDLEQLRVRVNEWGGEYPILPDLENRLISLAGRAGGAMTAWLLDLPEAIAKVFFALISVFTIAFMLLMTRERLLDLILSLVHPRHRATTNRVLAEMGERLGAYLRAKAIVVVIVGGLVWGTLVLLGSPYAVLVGIFAGLTEVLPRIGPWFGRAAIVVAVIPLGWRAVGIALVAHVVIENLKGQVISPLVEADQVDIHPLTAFIAVIAGGILLGWVGALIAVPVAAVLQVLVEEVLVPWRRARLEPIEATYGAGAAALAAEPSGTTAERPIPEPESAIADDGWLRRLARTRSDRSRAEQGPVSDRAKTGRSSFGEGS